MDENKDAIMDISVKAASSEKQSGRTPSFTNSQDDVERQVGTTTELKRKLKSRHLQMIAIGSFLIETLVTM